MKSMGFVDAVKSVLIENYANFKGRARRSEFWYYALFCLLLNSVIMFLAANVAPAIAFVQPLVGLALLIPNLAVVARRLHDIGKSAWCILFALIPLIGAIILLVWYCQDSQPGENKWGANPKE